MLELFGVAVSRGHPKNCMGALSLPVAKGRTLVVAAGKAAAPMAEAYVAARHPCNLGIIVSPDPESQKLPGFTHFKARHPVPDTAGIRATQHLMAETAKLGPDDLLVVLLSGGASALLVAPAPGLDLTHLQEMTANLLASGATIEEINTVRKHLSQIKGGRLAAKAAPARCLTYAISDVTGNDPSVIASGPTWPDTSSKRAAQDILTRYRIPQTEFLTSCLLAPPTFDAPHSLMSDYHLIATPEEALAAAARHARTLGLPVTDLGADLKGEAREMARRHAQEALKLATSGNPALILSGGEFTVTGAPQEAIGGPNHEFALALAIEMQGAPGIYAFAADTDGKDGNTGAAGAFVTPDTITRALSKGLDPASALAGHRAGSFFAELGDSHAKGSTGTNINDFRAILIAPEGTRI